MGRFAGMTVLYMDLPNGGTLAAFVARRYSERLLGLACLPALPGGAGLLIPGCHSVHTLGMRFRLDVLFVRLRACSVEVVELHSAVPPFRVVRAATSRVAVVELAAGEAGRLGLAPGLCLRHRPGGPRGLQPERPSDALG